MNRRTFKAVLAGTIVLLFMLCGLQSAIASKYYRMSGKISAIDLSCNTVVIHVPMEKGKVFTVGGPLAPGAILKKGDKQASLSDFKVGEQVSVKWKPTVGGHLILALISK